MQLCDYAIIDVFFLLAEKMVADGVKRVAAQRILATYNLEFYTYTPFPLPCASPT